MTDLKTLADLATFARLEVEANDIEPWAEIIRQLFDDGTLDTEQTLWLVKLYNAFDDLGSAWRVFEQCATPTSWLWGNHVDLAAAQPLSQERRGLRGKNALGYPRIAQHLDSYVDLLGGRSQLWWLREIIQPDQPRRNFAHLIPELRRVWGVGRQTAFEWAEFIAKAVGLAIETPDAYLAEATGPRESLERLYGDPPYPPHWLDERARECKTMLAGVGVDLSWWDFETVICDFNVMRKGRYYPGQHLAMIREEIDAVRGPGHRKLAHAYRVVIPQRWQAVPPGVDKSMARAYRDDGVIRVPIGVDG